MLGDLVDAPRRVGALLRRELEGLYSARGGAYRILHEIDAAATVTVLRIEHRPTAYQPR